MCIQVLTYLLTYSPIPWGIAVTSSDFAYLRHQFWVGGPGVTVVTAPAILPGEPGGPGGTAATLSHFLPCDL